MMERFEKALGYQFKEITLLRCALTHRSHSLPNNERLEFLGDAILDAIVGKLLFERFPDLPEGDLSRLRANLVRQETLHHVANTLKLGTYLRLGEGELKSGGTKRPSILADALEAVFGALWLDGGFEAVSTVVAKLYAELINALSPGEAMKDAKSRLQELLQGKKLPLPLYTLVSTQGESHAQQFKVSCAIPTLNICTEGRGQSRRAAEQEAAMQALEQLT